MIIFKYYFNYYEILRNKKGVESLEYGEKWISRFESFMIFFRVIIITFGVILFTGMLLIVSNTVKLSIYSRKEEIDLMLLLGATPKFIKIPLLMEGLLQGSVGVIFALGIIKLVQFYIEYQFLDSFESILHGFEFLDGFEEFLDGFEHLFSAFEHLFYAFDY